MTFIEQFKIFLCKLKKDSPDPWRRTFRRISSELLCEIHTWLRSSSLRLEQGLKWMVWCCVTVGSTPQGHVPSEIWFYSSRSSLISSIANAKLSLWLLKFRSTDLNLFIDQLIYLYKIYRCFQFLRCSVPIGNIEKMIAQIKIFVFDQAERVESILSSLQNKYIYFWR